MTSAAAAIEHPPHYQSLGAGLPGNIEVMDVLAKYGLLESFHLGNAAKYLLRAGRKGPVAADLSKALYYVRDFIARDLIEPVANESALEWHEPEEIAAAFNIGGAHCAAVIQLLRLCAFLDENEVGDDGVIVSPVELLARHIETAIAQAGEQA